MHDQLDARLELARTAARCSKLHTGSDTFVRPSMGSWITYGLGTENQDLPGFITICPTLTPRRRQQLELGLPAGRLSGHAAGQRQHPVRPGQDSVHRKRRRTPRDVQRLELDLLRRDRTASTWPQTGPDPALEGRIDSFELAFRMQTDRARAAGHLRRDRRPTHKLYGLDDPATANFGRQCLMARRFAERGVRFVQVTHSYKWDQHGDLQDRPRQERAGSRPADRRPARTT